MSRIEPSRAITSDVEKIIIKNSKTLDYESLFHFANMNGVSVLMYDNLKGVSSVPEGFRKRLENLYFSTLRNNVFHVRETTRILKLIQGKGIEVIPLKGSLASEMIFGNLGIYPTSDIDILVRPSDLYKTEEALRCDGYEKINDVDQDDLFDASYHVCYGNGKFVIEVHWNLVMRYFTAEPDFWWRDIDRTTYEGMDITLLSAERYVLYGIFRLFSHAFRPLRFSVLVSALIYYYGDKIDWQKLIALAESLRMKRLVVFTLQLMADLHGSEVPSSVADKKVSGYDFFKGYIVPEFFSSRQRKHSRMLIYSFLTDTPFAALRVIGGRIFPSVGEIRWRYGLSGNSGKVYLYYMLNPFLMLFKRR